MQRINLWPNPKFDPTGFHVVEKGGDISKYMTGGTLANTRGEYIDLPFACEVGVEYVCTCRIVSNDTTNKSIGIFFGGKVEYPSAQTVGKYTIRFTPTANDTRLAVPSGMAISELSVEAADTYDAALGGASGLLLGGHDAKGLRRFVGRVMSDDGHEHHQQSDRHNRSGGRHVDVDYDRSENDWHDVFCQCLSVCHGRCHQYKQQNHQLGSTPQLPAQSRRHEPVGAAIQSAVRQSDRQSDKHALLHAGGVPGEQDTARPTAMVQRGHDATRLTLALGVVA